MIETELQPVTTLEPKVQAAEIAYILKGYPRTSETFIINEIYLLEQLGLRLRLFAVKRIEGQKNHAVVEAIQAPLTYLPEATPLSEDSFPSWFRTNLPRFAPAVRKVFRNGKRAFFAAAAEMVKFSIAYRHAFFSLPRTVFLKEFLQACYIAAEIVDEPKVKLIHAHFCHGATTIAMFVSRLTGLPFSFTAHAKDIYLRELNPGDLLPKKLQRARFVVTCTCANKTHLDAVCPDGARVHTIYHGLDTSKFRPSLRGRRPNRKPLVLSVGRLVEKKGFDYLVRACRKLKERGHDFECLIVGGRDKYADVIERLIRELQVEDVVTLRDAVTQEELKHIYEEAAMFCLPCQVTDAGDRDGIPNVLAEAMAMELPVISTNISGIPEVVQDGVNGLLVSSKNVDELVLSMEAVLSNPGFGERLGKAARKTILEVFDSSANTVVLNDLFVKTLAKS